MPHRPRRRRRLQVPRRLGEDLPGRGQLHLPLRQGPGGRGNPPREGPHRGLLPGRSESGGLQDHPGEGRLKIPSPAGGDGFPNCITFIMKT